jgi:anti-sigma factor RsiW
MPHSANNILAALDSELDDDELNVIQDEIDEDPDADKEEDEVQRDNSNDESTTIRGSLSPPAK